jgi:hypothetical protein
MVSLPLKIGIRHINYEVLYCMQELVSAWGQVES